MNKKWLILPILLIILICALFYVKFYIFTEASPVHNLNTRIGYKSIQEAINANETKNGHSIFVEAGTYYERITVNKALSLIGKNATTTIIDGNNTANAIKFEADNCSITNFTIRNCIPQYGGHALTLENIKNCKIYGNSFENNYYGIRTYSSSNISIFMNNLTNNNVGILLISSFNNSIFENSVANHEYGFELISSSNNTFIRNKMTGNNRGIAFSLSSNNNSFCENNIENNVWGIEMGSSANNRLYHNNFTDNTYHVFYGSNSYPNIWDDGYPSGGNYWSNYNGTDMNGDGIGDTSYQININNTDNYPLTQPYIIPEFSTLHTLALFMATTLSVIIIHTRKRK